jgi:hypothetical protein
MTRVTEASTTRGRFAAQLADEVVLARADGQPDAHALRELRRMCAEAGVADADLLLSDARRRATLAAGAPHA